MVDTLRIEAHKAFLIRREKYSLSKEEQIYLRNIFNEVKDSDMPSYIANTREDERTIKDSDFIDRDGEIPYDLMEKYAKKIKAIKRYNEAVEKNHPYIGFALKKDFRPLIIALLYIKYHYLNLNCLEKVESAYSHSEFDKDREHYKQYELASYRLLKPRPRDENPTPEQANTVTPVKIADELLKQFEVDPNTVTADYTSSAKIADAFFRKLRENSRPATAVNTSHEKIEEELKIKLKEKQEIIDSLTPLTLDHEAIAFERKQILLGKNDIATQILRLETDQSIFAQDKRISLAEQDKRADARLTILERREKSIQSNITLIIKNERNAADRIAKLEELSKIYKALLTKVKERRKIANLSFNFTAKNIEKLLTNNSSLFKIGNIAALHKIFSEKVKRAKLAMSELSLKRSKSRIMQEIENYALPIFADYSNGLHIEPKGIIRHLELLGIVIKNKLKSLVATPPNSLESTPTSSPEKAATQRYLAHIGRPIRLVLPNDDDNSDEHENSSTMVSGSDSDSEPNRIKKDKHAALHSNSNEKTSGVVDHTLTLDSTCDTSTESGIEDNQDAPQLLIKGFRQATSKDIADLIEEDLIAIDKAPPKKRANTENTSITPNNPKDIFLDRAYQKIEVLDKIIYKAESIIENLDERANNDRNFKKNPVYKNKKLYEELKTEATIDINAIKALTRHCGMLRFSENKRSDALKQSCLAFTIQRSIGCTASPGATPQCSAPPSRENSPRPLALA